MKESAITIERTVPLSTVWFRVLFMLIFNVITPIAMIVYAFVNGFEDWTGVLLFVVGFYFYNSIAMTATYMMLLKNNNY